MPQAQGAWACAAQAVRPAIVLPKLDQPVIEIKMGFHVVPMPGDHVQSVALVLRAPRITPAAVLLRPVEHVCAEWCLSQSELSAAVLIERPLFMTELVARKELQIFPMIDIHVVRCGLWA